jgi:hypothetical protein
MAKTNAQRQAEYRTRRRRDGENTRLNIEVSLEGDDFRHYIDKGAS